MQEKVKAKKIKGVGLYLLALIFLTNPCVGIFDILPDFVGYLILMKKLSYGVGRAPYFEEAKRSLGIMALISTAKIPAFFIMSISSSKNVGDGDIKALFALTFFILETLFILSALNNLFSALFYLGERSDASALICAFGVGRKNSSISPEFVRSASFAFAIFKGAVYTLPELLLLSRDPEATASEFNFSLLYPYAVVLSVLLTLIFAIALIVIIYSYIKAVASEGKFHSAIENLLDDKAKRIADKNDAVRKMRLMLTLLTAASIFTLELRFDNFDGINLLPHFLYGIMLIAATRKLAVYTGKNTPGLASAAAYTFVSVATYVCECTFLYKYGYSSIASSEVAKTAYIPVIILLSAELLLLAVSLIFISRSLSKYVLLHTGLEIENERYTHHDALYHKNMQIKVYIWLGVSISTGIVKLIDSALKYFTVERPIMQNPLLGTVTESVAPWFGLVTLLFCALNIGYSVYLFGILKDDTTMKYSEHGNFTSLTV